MNKRIFFILQRLLTYMICIKIPILFQSILTLILLVSCTSELQIGEASGAKVYVQKTDDGYTLVRNGKPFFIKGACGNQFLKELKDAGANTVRLYDTTNLKRVLDFADSLGLAVVLDIPMPRYEKPDTIFSNQRRMDLLLKDTRKFVRTYQDHPAILYWILGNEINYPDLPGVADVTENFNALLAIVHEEDPNHPVSTAIGGFQRSTILSIETLSGSIDLISINVFGELSTFAERKKTVALLWDGPYVFSEIGINGPWEAENTLWSAPIEETSNKKAEQFRHRFIDNVANFDDGRFLGSLFFYWGHKQERTHTWFSTVDENGRKTQTAFEFESYWTGQNRTFIGPEIHYALLNGRGAKESIILGSAEKASASLFLIKEEADDMATIHWNIRPENWNYEFDAVEKQPPVVNGLNMQVSGRNLTFVTPKNEGPYRLYVSVEDKKGYIATTNVPFYILDTTNER